jgi:AraC-like DNA-binding protein
MITNVLPNPHNISASSRHENTPGNTVIYARTSQKYNYPVHETPYLFVTNYINTGAYTINGRAANVSDKVFYLLQPGSKLAIHFKTALPLQTLLILFDTGFVNKVIHQCTTPQADLLDNLQQTGERYYIPAIPFLTNKKLRALLTRCTSTGTGETELQYLLCGLIEECCKVNSSTTLLMQKLRVVKPSTREELYRRLNTALLFIHDNTCENPTLDDMASAACLNKFHFLRAFGRAFGTTPHQYLTRLKLEKSAELLKSREHGVNDVCAMVGFESPGSFGNLFKKQFGVTPGSLLKE